MKRSWTTSRPCVPCAPRCRSVPERAGLSGKVRLCHRCDLYRKVRGRHRRYGAGVHPCGPRLYPHDLPDSWPGIWAGERPNLWHRRLFCSQAAETQVRVPGRPVPRAAAELAAAARCHFWRGRLCAGRGGTALMPGLCAEGPARTACRSGVPVDGRILSASPRRSSPKQSSAESVAAGKWQLVELPVPDPRTPTFLPRSLPVARWITADTRSCWRSWAATRSCGHCRRNGARALAAEGFEIPDEAILRALRPSRNRSNPGFRPWSR